MIPIILSPKYAGGGSRDHNSVNNSTNNTKTNNYNKNQSTNQTVQDAELTGRPLGMSNYHSASAYNISNNAPTFQHSHQSSYDQNDTSYNTHYATTARTTHKYYSQEQATQNNKKVSQSQSSINQGQKKESSGGFLATLSGTLGRKKKSANNQQSNLNEVHDNSKELTVEQIENEGKEAIDSNIMPRLPKFNGELGGPDESRVVIDEGSVRDSEFLNLVQTLVNWINDELNEQRIIIKHLEEDLYDGQVLGRLVEKLSRTKLDVVEFTQNEDLQKHKLRQVLETLNRMLSQQTDWAQIKWSVEGIHSRNIVQIIHLLVSMIRFFRPPVKLPANVSVRVNVITKQNVVAQSLDETLTGQYDETGMRDAPRDVFDTLFDHAPDKLTLVKRSICGFVNKHLNKINIECFSMHASGDLDPNQFSDGLLLIFLMASLENYFVPLGNIFTQPVDPVADMSPQGVETAVQHENYVNTSPIHKLHNVNIAFQLMKDSDIDVRERVRAEDIVNADLKSTLRVLYMIFNKYKNN